MKLSKNLGSRHSDALYGLRSGTASGLLDHPHAGGVADELLELLVEGLGGDEAAGYGHLLLLG